MDGYWKEVLRRQFGAAIDMLENAIRACPDDLWSDQTKRPEWTSNDIVGVWYLAYHTLFYLDFYLSDSMEDFGPPVPFNRDVFDPAGLLPEKAYSKEVLLGYLDHGRRKCNAAIEGLTDEKARQQSRPRPELKISVAELLLDNLRHVQHHAAQMNLVLRQKTGNAPHWVTTSRQ
jgi:hypothetical protein